MVRAYIGLGANLGDPHATVLWAIDQLGRLPDTVLHACSGLYWTEPVDATGPPFVNAVAAIDTCLNAPQLLEGLQQLEQQAGRQRPYRNAPRTLDLDLLLYGTSVIKSPNLEVPHPRMMERAFVLVPLVEIAPHCVAVEHLRAVQGQSIHRFE